MWAFALVKYDPNIITIKHRTSRGIGGVEFLGLLHKSGRDLEGRILCLLDISPKVLDGY